MKTCLTLAATLFSAAIVAFLISEYARKAEEDRQALDKRRQQEDADALERRRLVGELRDIHHAVKTAQLRIDAHKTVRTYGNEVRDVIMPSVARLGGVISDVRGQRGKLFSPDDADTIADQVGGIRVYLTALTEEFTAKYLPASQLQEAIYRWRQYRVEKLVEQRQFSTVPPTESDLPQAGAGNEWHHLTFRNSSGEYRFARLAIFLELPEAMHTDRLESHQERFSDPLRAVMDRIELSYRP